MKYSALLLIFFILSGCDFGKTVYKNQSEEAGSIQSIQFIPSNSSISPGITMSGKFVASYNSSPSHYIVIIHSPSAGNFSLENKALFDIVQIQESVQLHWTELWTIYKDREKFNRKKLEKVCIRNDCVSI